MPFPLDDAFCKNRGKWLVDEIRHAIRDRADLDGKLQMIRSLYYMDKDPAIGLPWEGASDMHLPVVYEKIEAMVPKVVNAFWGTEPIVHVRRVAQEFMPEETDNAERIINWGVGEDIFPNFYDTSENWFRNALRDGMSTLKVYWLREWEKTVEIHRVKAVYDAGQMTVHGVEAMDARAKTPDEILMEIFGRPSAKHGLLDAEEQDREDVPPGEHMFEELIGLTYDIDFIDDRRRQGGRVVFRLSEYVDEIDVYVYRHVLRHDRPCVEVVEHEDLIVPFRTRDIQDADWVAHQYWLDKSEIERRVDEGTFRLSDEDLDALLNRRKTRQDEMEENQDLKRQKDRVIGEGVKEQRHQTAAHEDSMDEDQFTDNNKFLFFEIYLRDDIDSDNDPIEVIYHVSYDLRKVIGYDYLSEVFPHNRRPFPTIKYKSVSDRWYGQGVGEVLVPINLEVNTILNYVNNNQELINNPFFFYVPAAMHTDMKPIQPGEGIPIGDVNGVVFPRFNQEPLANLSAMDTLMLFADRMTISPMNAGSTPVRHAPRTARGTMALLGEGNVQLDNMITRWQRTGWEELMHQLMGLYQSFMSDDKYIRVTGDNGVVAARRVSPADIRGRYTFSFTGNTVNTNREVLRTIAQMRYQTIMTHPDMAMDPVARREALKDLLRHFSEGVDISRLVPALPGQGSHSHPPMTQQSENQAMLHGIPIDVLPTDDHAGHLQVLEQFQRSPAFETMPEDRVILFAMHSKQHIEIMQQQQRMTQQPMSGGMANNVPTDVSQVGGQADLNMLEGGVQ